MDLNSMQRQRQINNDFINNMIANHKLDQKILSPHNTESIDSSNMTDQIIKMFNQPQKMGQLSSPTNINNYLSQNSENKYQTEQTPREDVRGESVISEIDNIIDRIKKKYQFNSIPQTLSNHDDNHKNQTEEPKILEQIENQDIYVEQNTDDLILSIKKKIKVKYQNENLQSQEEKFEEMTKEEYEPNEKNKTPKRVSKYYQQELDKRDQKNSSFDQKINSQQDVPNKTYTNQNEIKQQAIPKFIQKQLHQTDDSIKKLSNNKFKENLQQLQRTYKDNQILPKEIQYEISDKSISDQNQYSGNNSASQQKKEPENIDFHQNKILLSDTPTKQQKQYFNETDVTFQTPQRNFNFEAISNLSYSQSQLSYRHQTVAKSIDELIQNDQILLDLNREEALLVKELQLLQEEMKEINN